MARHGRSLGEKIKGKGSEHILSFFGLFWFYFYLPTFWELHYIVGKILCITHL